MRENFPKIPIEKICPQEEMTEKGKEYDQETKKELTEYIFKYWRGDAHTHTQESTRWDYVEGIYDKEEFMKYYQDLGLEFVAFSDHASKPGEPEKLKYEDKISQDLLKQAEEIKNINQEGKFDLAAFSSVESNIFFTDNEEAIIDLPPEVLKKLDLVIASRHAIKNEKDINAIKESLLSAINNPYVDVIGHPDRYIRLNQGATDKGGPCSPEIYWDTWNKILDEVNKNGKAFEVNFNNPPADELLEIAASKGTKFMLNYDAHDFNQYKKGIPEGEKAKKNWAKDEACPEDLEILQKYKLDRLTSGPGVKAISRLVKFIKKLEKLDVTPEKIINSSRENMINFLTKDRNKSTENLEFLKEKFIK